MIVLKRYIDKWLKPLKLKGLSHFTSELEIVVRKASACIVLAFLCAVNICFLPLAGFSLIFP
jgi:hypothetical protein